MCVQADGVLGLQKGLSAAMSYQMLVNSIRLGLYSRVLDSGLITRPDGSVAPLGSLLAGMGAGTVSALASSPIVMVTFPTSWLSFKSCQTSW